MWAMMSRDDALERASTILAADGPTFAMHARALVEYAAELRLTTAAPVIDRILEQASKRLPPEDPATRLTLHDVEAGTCFVHQPGGGWRVRIRDRRASSDWWMHADDQSTCA
jgi:hypothetical protein